MPHKNTIRTYLKDSYYHLYNRGVEKRKIFLDKPDYLYFIEIIKYYLTTPPNARSNRKTGNFPYWRSNLHKNEVAILCFGLMPNHFHFLIKQNTVDGLTRFMRRISNAYVRYFNKKYDRVGSLFQGKFKAALIKTEPYLLHLSRYIHLNPLEVGPLKTLKIQNLADYPYSSYPTYLNHQNGVRNSWIETETILSYFERSGEKAQSYQLFVEASENKSRSFLRELTLD